MLLRSKHEVKLESVSLEELEAAIQIDVYEPDADLPIQALFTDYQTTLRDKKWERLVKHNPKLAIKHISGLLKPAALKTEV